MKPILIIGATGMLGKPVAKELQSVFNIRVLVRDVEKAEKIFNQNNCEFIEGNIFDDNALEKGIKECQGIHINLSGEIEQKAVEFIVTKAKNKGIERITYISGMSVSPETIWFPVQKRKYYAEQAIISNGIPYTIFCPTWFMESLPKYIKVDKAYIFGEQRNPYHFIAAEDYAKMVLTAYQKDEAINKRFIIHGKEGFLFKQAVEMYIKELHPKIKSVTQMPYFFAKLIGNLTGKKEMKDTATLMQFFEKVGELGNPKETYKLLGEPQINLENWIEKRKKAVANNV